MKYPSVICAGLVVAGLNVPAYSQSNVTISGFLDQGIYKKSGQSTQVGTLGRSNLAFSGVEDLGGGLKATFRLSTRFEIDTGTLENAPAGLRQFFQDESTLGLSGDFGAVRLGRALTPLNAKGWSFDPWYAYDRVGSPLFWFIAPDFLTDPGNVKQPTGVDMDYTRMANAVFYDSPTFLGGFTAHLNTVVEKKPVDLQRGFASALKYVQGPLSLMADFEKNSQQDRLIYLGAAYQWGKLGVMGTYSNVKLNADGSVYGANWTNWAAASNPTTKRTSMTLGATYAVGAGTIRAGYGRDFQGSTNYFNYIGSSFNNAGTGYSGPSNFYSVGYQYSLSKRTSVVADLTRVTWKFTDDKGRTHANGIALGMKHFF
jgi:predicted porin